MTAPSPSSKWRRSAGGPSVSAIGLGGYHIGVPATEDEGIRIIRTAVDRGIIEEKDQLEGVFVLVIEGDLT